MNFKKQRGFTLVEIMVVVVIIAILSAVAWPAYQNYVTRSNRTAAQSCLLEQAQFMERFYTQNMSYETSRNGASVALPNSGCTAQLADKYNFEIEEVDDDSYVLVASPLGAQEARDSKCGVLGVDQTGSKTATGDSGDSGCW